ncbi:MAG: hypothetical protein HRT89_23545 [Lentisphaeria bacterium]|nr:hypothetical protein [Lentisphaeria bacterium]NQZ71036.1 hypothetical protein [Lentisphaeria bacterium]
MSARHLVPGISSSLILLLTIAFCVQNVSAEDIVIKSAARTSLSVNLNKLAGEDYASGARRKTSGNSGGRTKTRLLYSFENGKDGQPLKGVRGQRMKVTCSLDFGVTEGKKCARLVSPAGGGFSELYFSKNKIKNWRGFDYLAIDLFTEDKHSYGISLELSDNQTRAYMTRCTMVTTTSKGHQTLYFPIGRAKRNGKEGRTWAELQAKDKIKLNGLKQVKIFLTTRQKRAGRFWIDNIRLLQEDAAKPKMRLSLPGAVTHAFDFGSAGAVVPGFTAVTAKDKYTDAKGYGFTHRIEKMVQAGSGWPDLLAGTFVRSNQSDVMKFQAKVPNGDYLVWTCMGKALKPQLTKLSLRFRINDTFLVKADPSLEEYDGEKFLYRFMRTQYSQRPHALWLDYVNRMYEVSTEKITVTDGLIKLVARNCFISGMIVMPAKHEADFKRMSAKIQKTRLAAFEKLTKYPEKKAVKKESGDGDYVLYVPNPKSDVRPDTSPNADERKRTSLRAAGAVGQNVIMRVAMSAFKDLGACKLELSDLKGPGGTIPKSAIKGHFANFKYTPRWTPEMVLMPELGLYCEKDLTQCFWLWMAVPEDSKPGIYKGTFQFRTSKSKTTALPISFEVYPFKLEKNLPGSFGMYYNGRSDPRPSGALAGNVMKEQMKWMRKIGFTSVTVPGVAHVTGVNVAAGSVEMTFNAAPLKAAMAAGLGQTKDQVLLLTQLGIARQIARRLPGIGGAKVDQKPGIELRQSAFKPLWMNAMKQYKTFLDDLKVPYAIEIIDEPRETPNPWNRNLKDTMTYGKWMGQVGLKRFITPMGDKNAGKDYVGLVNVSDIVSIHGAKAAPRFYAKTKATRKTLWFYNIGMGRKDWGFKSWGYGATGNFQWHWCWVEGWAKAAGDYPGREWYNPFTPMHGASPNAPLTETNPGGFNYSSGYLTVADGLSDYRYVYTLEQRIAANKRTGKNASAVAKGEALLKEIKARVTGKGAKTETVWREKIAVILVKLK